jgi:hypothetical protein
MVPATDELSAALVAAARQPGLGRARSLARPAVDGHEGAELAHGPRRRRLAGTPARREGGHGDADQGSSHLEEDTVRNYDIKKERKDLYAPKPGRFEIIDVPEMGFLMVDGRGDPNTSVAYREAVEALYAASYAVRAVGKQALERVHTVAPLEGLWSAADLAVFRTREKSAWDWTMMIAQPDWTPPVIIENALAAARTKKQLPALDLVRFERYAEGRSVQLLHIGSYDDEGPALERLHEEFLPAHGLVPVGRHHEIYLSDARRTEPAKLRTILRQPVAARNDVGSDGRSG